ncbi:Transposase IS66 family protein [Pseudobutyrivibrio sp. AR14]|uniref:IS66 family transposase n=1 Tax=Pseudobutyrivibrio sp. AR14 TaxID=1520804 RepID=UPI000886785A|nr:transposase [Pseudobutyrivibrio sp. AR14]SCY25222.1 Transposase IS66 family protein [Pseudobutyrivibrio sp. AR14]
MTLNEAYEKRRQELLVLQRENAQLKSTIERLSKGTYVDAEKAEHIRTINRLTQENRHLANELNRYKGLYRQQVIVRENFNASASDAVAELDSLKDDLQYYKNRCEVLENRLDAILKNSASENAKLLAQVDALKEALLKEKAKSDTDSTNSSLPTSKTPIGKKKHIPNSREKSERSRGGQPGHKKHSLSPFSSDEVNEIEEFKLDSCPDCGSGSLTFLERREKDVLDYEVRVIKKRNFFYIYQCDECGHIVHSPIPLNLKENIQYGSNVQALALSLTNTGFVSINRTRRIINGLTGGNVQLSEGYICKLQQRAYDALDPFEREARMSCITSDILCWDDTVIFINTSRACLRFYGNEHVALFLAHEKKDRASIDDDAILTALPEDTFVMHDHLVMNYNDDFHFKNVECNQHLQRDLQKLFDISHLQWAVGLKKLISTTIHDRNTLIKQSKTGFDREYICEFNKKLDQILCSADIEHKETIGHYYEADSRKLIKRIKKFRDNYFLWITDFSIPVTNNISERNLRPAKIKQKVSGQYIGITSARYFARIRTYLQTCRIYNISEVDAMSRLTKGFPYTLSELVTTH